MPRILPAFVLALSLLLATPTLAQDDALPDAPGAPTVQERFEALIDRLLGQIEPELDALGETLGEMLGDLRGWHAPEVLPNGDIIIRRRAQPSEPDPSDEAAPPVTDPFEL